MLQQILKWMIKFFCLSIKKRLMLKFMMMKKKLSSWRIIRSCLREFLDKLGKLAISGCIILGMQGDLHTELWNVKLMKNSSLGSGEMYNFAKIFYQNLWKMKTINLSWFVGNYNIIFPWGNIIFIEQHIQIMVDKQERRILTILKLLCFIIWNDQLLVHFIEQCKM